MRFYIGIIALREASVHENRRGARLEKTMHGRDGRGPIDAV